jgi:hypothetical protein
MVRRIAALAQIKVLDTFRVPEFMGTLGARPVPGTAEQEISASEQNCQRSNVFVFPAPDKYQFCSTATIQKWV